MGRKSYQIAPRRTMRDSDDCGVTCPDQNGARLVGPGHSPVSQPQVTDGHQLATDIDQRNMAAHPRQYGVLLEQVLQRAVVWIAVTGVMMLEPLASTAPFSIWFGK